MSRRESLRRDIINAYDVKEKMERVGTRREVPVVTLGCLRHLLGSLIALGVVLDARLVTDIMTHHLNSLCEIFQTRHNGKISRIHHQYRMILSRTWS